MQIFSKNCIIQCLPTIKSVKYSNSSLQPSTVTGFPGSYATIKTTDCRLPLSKLQNIFRSEIWQVTINCMDLVAHNQAPVGILTEGHKENQETPTLLYWPAIKESLASDFCRDCSGFNQQHITSVRSHSSAHENQELTPTAK